MFLALATTICVAWERKSMSSGTPLFHGEVRENFPKRIVRHSNSVSTDSKPIAGDFHTPLGMGEYEHDAEVQFPCFLALKRAYAGSGYFP